MFDFKINSLSYELRSGLVSGHNIQQERKTLTLDTYSAGKLIAVFAQMVACLD